MLTEKEIVKEYLRRRLDKQIDKIKLQQRKGIIVESVMWQKIDDANKATEQEIEDLRLYYID